MFWRIEVFLNKGLFNKKFRKRVQLGFSFSSADIAFLTWYDGCWNLQEDESDEDKLPPVVSTKFQTASVVNLVTTLFKTKKRIVKFKNQLTLEFFAVVNYLSGSLRKQKFTSTGSKGHALWFDWWISIYFVCSCVSGFFACDHNYDWRQRKTQL